MCSNDIILVNSCHFIKYLLSAVLSSYVTADPYNIPAWKVFFLFKAKKRNSGCLRLHSL